MLTLLLLITTISEFFSVPVLAATPTAPDVTLITTPPRIIERDDPYTLDDFIGYFTSSAGGIWSYSYCAGALQYTETKVGGAYFGGCFETSTFPGFTECIGQSIYGIFETASCTFECLTDYLVDDSLSTSYFVTCGNRSPRTLYRVPFTELSPVGGSVSTTAYSSGLVGSSIPSSISRPTLPIPIPSTSSISPISVPVPTTSSPTPNPTNHTGAIAGGVVGGVAVIALIAAGVFLLVRKRRRAALYNGEVHADQPVMSGKNGVSTQQHPYPGPHQSYPPTYQQN